MKGRKKKCLEDSERRDTEPTKGSFLWGHRLRIVFTSLCVACHNRKDSNPSSWSMLHRDFHRIYISVRFCSVSYTFKPLNQRIHTWVELPAWRTRDHPLPNVASGQLHELYPRPTDDLTCLLHIARKAAAGFHSRRKGPAEIHFRNVIISICLFRCPRYFGTDSHVVVRCADFPARLSAGASVFLDLQQTSDRNATR
jgi:hypothetical protein